MLLRPYRFWIGTMKNTVSHEFICYLMNYDLLMSDASSPIFVLKKFKLDYLWPKYNAWRERLTTNFLHGFHG